MKIMDIKDINWNTVWKEQHEANINSRGSGDCAMMWSTKEQAQKFYLMTQENPERIDLMLSNFSLSPHKRVLDIGSGPGTLAIPLCEQVAHVTAVEPSFGMVEVMQDRIRENSINNLTIVQKRWEDIDIQKDLNPPYDLVIAANSLGMPDIQSAIEMMQKVCSGEIWLFWFAGTTNWEKQMNELWPKIHNRPYIASPKSDTLFHVLYQMGIYPDMQVRDMEHTRTYSSLLEAVEDIRGQMNCTNDHDELIKEFISHELKEQDGKFIRRGMTKRVSFNWRDR